MVYLTIIAGLELAVIAYLIWRSDRKDAQRDEVLADFSLRAERERMELVQHIKRPEYVTPPPRGSGPAQAKPSPELAKIGTYAPRAEAE